MSFYTNSLLRYSFPFHYHIRQLQIPQLRYSKSERGKKQFFTALVLASLCILSRNYLLLTSRSRKRSPSLASIVPLSSSLPSSLGASLFLSFSFFSSFPLFSFALQLSRNHSIALTDATTLRYSGSSLHAAQIFSLKYAASHQRRATTRERDDKLKGKREKELGFIILWQEREQNKNGKNCI